MASDTRIEDVQERVADFTAALRTAGEPQLAERIDALAGGFVDATEVRRGVDAIKQQLEHFRRYPDELPDAPVVMIAANRLEDACKELLRAGLIAPARLSLAAATKRLLRLATITAFAGGLALMLPLALALCGVDLTDLGQHRRLPALRLVKGEEASVPVNVLVESLDPAATSGVVFYVAGHCSTELRSAASCRRAGERPFGDDSAQAYEIMRDGEAYGLLVGFGGAQLIGRVGTGKVLIAATPDTAQGHYVVPLSAAFVGYALASCQPWQRWLGTCGVGARGPQYRHADLPVPDLVVDVVAAPAGFETATDRRRRQQAAERRRRAAARASQIAGAVAQIKRVLDDTQKLLQRRRYEAVRERIDKLEQLFEPLDALAVTGADSEPLPDDVVALRARFQAQRAELSAFGDRAFDAVYDAQNPKHGAAPDEDRAWNAVARKLGISRAYLEAIYAEHADQLEARIQAAQAAAREKQAAAARALVQRCGSLPTNAFHEVQAYLAAMGRSVGVTTAVHECFTPRLDDKTCYSVVCDFEERIPSEDQVHDEVRRHKWTFYLQRGRVQRHVERVVDDPKPGARGSALQP